MTRQFYITVWTLLLLWAGSPIATTHSARPWSNTELVTVINSQEVLLVPDTAWVAVTWEKDIVPDHTEGSTFLPLNQWLMVLPAHVIDLVDDSLRRRAVLQYVDLLQNIPWVVDAVPALRLENSSTSLLIPSGEFRIRTRPAATLDAARRDSVLALHDSLGVQVVLEREDIDGTIWDLKVGLLARMNAFDMARWYTTHRWVEEVAPPKLSIVLSDKLIDVPTPDTLNVELYQNANIRFSELMDHAVLSGASVFVWTVLPSVGSGWNGDTTTVSRVDPLTVRFRTMSGDQNNARIVIVTTWDVFARTDTLNAVLFPPVTTVTRTDTRPQRLLKAPYPNPFNARVTLSTTGFGEGRLDIKIIDPLGRVIKSFSTDTASHTLVWDGRDSEGRQVASGIYTVSAVTATGIATREIALIR